MLSFTIPGFNCCFCYSNSYLDLWYYSCIVAVIAYNILQYESATTALFENNLLYIPWLQYNKSLWPKYILTFTFLAKDNLWQEQCSNSEHVSRGGVTRAEWEHWLRTRFVFTPWLKKKNVWLSIFVPKVTSFITPKYLNDTQRLFCLDWPEILIMRY